MRPKETIGYRPERAQMGFEHGIIADAGNPLEGLRRNARRAGWDMEELEARIARLQAGERKIAEHQRRMRDEIEAARSAAQTADEGGTR